MRASDCTTANSAAVDATVVCVSMMRTSTGLNRGCFFFQAEDGIRYHCVTGVQTCALPIFVAYAADRGRFVRVDMEDSPHTEATLEIVHDTYRHHENTGAVLQAYMRRSIEDVQRVIDAGFSVRLCKGIYDEPRSIAYKDFDTVRQNYIFLLDELLKGGIYVGIATHDEFLIWHALRLIHQLEVPEDRYEFQMLLGVDEELRSILVGAGHKLRVYVPFGEDWYEYSTRRLKENPKIAGYVARDVIGSMTARVKG